MKKRKLRFEKTFWVFFKLMLYVCLLGVFMLVMGKVARGVINLSRTMGIVILTFAILELLFVKTYGEFDIGRRKSKPIIFSQSFAILFTDIILYLEVMIMKVTTVSSDFRLIEPWLLIVVLFLQIVIITVFAYAGNGLFFMWHDPETCYVICKDQEGLNDIVRCVTKLKKQYKIVGAIHYESPRLEEVVKGSDATFLNQVPASYRAKIMKLAYKYKKNVYVSPEIEDIMEVSSTLYLIDDTVMVNYLKHSFTFEQRVAKRLLDIGLSVLLGILTAPIIAITALCIKLEDGGPVFYKQERATINGRIFNVLKLRSMKENDNSHSATADDDRITKVGKFIRRTRIDEIPQIYNVLKGEMTFVGPRPEMVKNVEMYTEALPEFSYRLRVKAGLTGYAQIQGKYNTTPKDKLIMDMMYIEQFSILLDIQLIFQTFIAVIRPDSSEGFMDDKEGNCLGLKLDTSDVGGKAR